MCGVVSSEKNGLKSLNTSLLLSNVIDADHQNMYNCLFSSWGLIGVLVKFQE